MIYYLDTNSLNIYAEIYLSIDMETRPIIMRCHVYSFLLADYCKYYVHTCIIPKFQSTCDKWRYIRLGMSVCSYQCSTISTVYMYVSHCIILCVCLFEV